MDTDEYVVNGDDLIAEVVADYPEAAAVLAENGMHCVGCASSTMETLFEACRAHGLRAGKILLEINRRILQQ